MYQENISKSELKQRTGVDLEQYRTDVVADSLTELIESPFTIMLHLILWPLLLLILLVVSGIWWIWPMSWGAGFLWIVGGLIMGPISGLTLGGFLAAWSLSESSKNLYEASLDTMKVIAGDLKDNYQQIAQNHALPTQKEWMRILRLALIVPVVREVIRRKLWPFGDWIANKVVINFTKTTEKGLLSLQTDIETQKTYTKEELQNYCLKLIEKTEKMRKNSASVHKTATMLTLAPLRFATILMFVLDVLLFGAILYCAN